MVLREAHRSRVMRNTFDGQCGLTSEVLHVWFEEPATPDPTWCGRRESAIDWLGRSTLPRAVACRRFLNENLASFDSTQQAHLVHALNHRWASAFFELIVGRTLQLLGAKLSFEEAASTGRRPDFRAVFPDCAITVEAAAPLVNAGVAVFDNNQAPLLDFVESCIPQGWSVGVRQLPDLGPQDSKREFKAAIREMLDLAAPSDDEIHTLWRDTPDGVIELWTISNARIDSDRLLTGTGSGFMDDTESRIRHTLKRKRGQVRGSGDPVVLAIWPNGLASGAESFDHALYGRTSALLGLQGEVISTGFETDGDFLRPSAGRPTYAGVLAFGSVGFHPCDQPVLYKHPRFNGVLPASFDALESKSFDAGGRRVVVEGGSSTDLMTGLHPVGASS